MTVAAWGPSQTEPSQASVIVSRVSVMTSTWSADILEEHEGYWIVRNVETGIFGTGEDPDQAVEDFERALREHFDVLGRQEALSDELAAQLAYLRQRLA